GLANTCCGLQNEKDKKMIEMELIRILMNETRGEQMVVLKEKGGKRTLPIIIGIPEASAIKLKISGIRTPRPMTHDLLKNIIEQLGATLKEVIIDRLEENTFYAKLVLNGTGDKAVVVDARPSDSIALALRAGCPIFATENLLNQVGTLDGS
ncbi:MAG: bifunctional nuclease family protein, partial [Candidatus Omnitrophica bacterium]|nr:bifunctional nuclease family protein [Candidatus Omnitrophota bacterium]